MDYGKPIPYGILHMLIWRFSGALVLYDPNDPHADLYDVDDESTVIVLGDWYRVSYSLWLYGPGVTNSAHAA